MERDIYNFRFYIYVDITNISSDNWTPFNEIVKYHFRYYEK